MIGDLHNYMTVGILQPAAFFPQAGKPDWKILEALPIIAQDDFFLHTEIVPIRDRETRQAATGLIQTAGLTLDIDAAGPLMEAGTYLNSLDRANRARAVDLLKWTVDEAYAMGAQAVTPYSGPDPGDENRPASLLALLDSLQQVCAYAQSLGEVKIALKVGDRAVDKKFLIGPTADAVKLAQRVREEWPNFGLVMHLSHLPLLFEKPSVSLKLAAPYIFRAHIGNCMLKPGPLYGDSHPHFGYPGGENDIPELGDYLHTLLAIGYVGPGSSNVVAFEVRPVLGQDPRLVIANDKRSLLRAWAQV